MVVREAGLNDLDKLMLLYTQLNKSNTMNYDANIDDIYKAIIADDKQFVFIVETEYKLVSTCMLSIISNLTHSQRPYAIIENVVTDEKHRKKGYAEKVLRVAIETARKRNCHKIVLMTYSKFDYVRKLYEKIGFDCKKAMGFVLDFERGERYENN